jgi:2-polyprenyl-3-methyl-5-hydroxy-6-metoxy-1,4-benzoquinol methylase
VNLSTEIPDQIKNHLSSAAKITEEVKKLVGDKTHGSYFDSSTERYNHYFAAADAFLTKGSLILDIGNAPGHVGIGLHILGMKIQGLNLNDLWLSTYPSTEWPTIFNVISHDIERAILPFDDNMFDAIYFTEVLEHLAIKNPAKILPEFLRVLKPGGLMVLSTPNICNISNIYSLMNGNNIFWPRDIFYGSLDRHNREYTPQEVQEIVAEAGFTKTTMYGFNCSSNWRSGGIEFAIDMIRALGDNHPLLRNTIMVYAFK